MRHDDRVRLKHMLDGARDAVAIAQRLEWHALIEDRGLTLGIVKSIEIIGEAASRISNDFRSANATIPWREVIAMRNRLVHV